MPYDTINEYDSWKVMIKKPAIDDTFAKFLDLEGHWYFIYDGMNPRGDLLSGWLWLNSVFIHESCLILTYIYYY